MGNAPVERIATDPIDARPESGAALCLSGGGYRAMLFHTGSLWRMYEAGLLQDVKRISSVSGGSIAAAVLGMYWSRLSFDPAKLHTDFVPLVVTPIRSLAGKTVDTGAVVRGIFTPGRVSEKIADAFDRHLFHEKTLQDLPDSPRFVINATNVQSGALWRFMKPYMRDWRVGEVKRPTTRLAQAVAASCAFPPVLSPYEMRIDPDSFTPNTGYDLQRVPYTSRVLLTDGGVYDNLGLETAWKRYRTILVSDGGGKLEPEAKPKSDWGRHAYRALQLVDNQVRSLRKRQLIDSYVRNDRDGAYWSIRSDIENYGPGRHFRYPVEHTTNLARTPTRLKRLDNQLQEKLINWGYAVCDAALRAHIDRALPKPVRLPYPYRTISSTDGNAR